MFFPGRVRRGALRGGGVCVLIPPRPGLQVVRGLGMLGSALFFIMAMQHLPLAEAAAISFVSPVFVTVLSILLLAEKVGIRRWAALLVGLAGVIIVSEIDKKPFEAAMTGIYAKAQRDPASAKLIERIRNVE